MKGPSELMRRFFLPLAAVSILVICLIWGLVIFRLQSSSFREAVINGFENFTDSKFEADQSEVVYLPVPGIRFQNANFQFQKPVSSLRASSAMIYLRLIPMVFGKLEISSVEVKNGTLEIATGLTKNEATNKIRIENFQATLDSTPLSRFFNLDMQGDVTGGARAVITGRVGIENSKHFDWKMLTAEGHMIVDPVQINRFPADFLAEWLGAQEAEFRQGTIGGSVAFEKKSQADWIGLKGEFDIKEFIYQLTMKGRVVISPSINTVMNFHADWNPFNGEVIVRPTAIELPFGQLEVSGQASLEEEKVQELRMRLRKFRLEAIPEYFLSIKDDLPFNTGFSGESDLEVSVQGSLGNLQLHGSWDLTQSFLTYSRFFSKPKDFPFTIAFDFLINEDHDLSGDFSARCLETSVKGNISKMNLLTRQGAINVLSNKFSLQGWEKLIPALEGFGVRGAVKVLVSGSGDFKNPEQLKTVWNVSVDDGELTVPSGKKLSKISGLLDMGDASLELKNVRMEFEGGGVDTSLVAYNHRSPEANMKGTFQGAQLKPDAFLEALQEVGIKISDPAFSISFWDSLKNQIRFFFPDPAVLDTLVFDYSYADRKFSVQESEFSAFGGTGEFDCELNTADRSWKGSLEADKISLAQFFSKTQKQAAPLEGNLFLKLNLQGSQSAEGDWKNNLIGDGSFSVTNGEIKGLDLMGSVNSLPALSFLELSPDGKTVFTDIRSPFTIKEGKISMPQLKLMGRDVSSDGEGILSLDGTLNYRLGVYLEKQHVRKLGDLGAGQDEKLGPVPFLLLGSLSEPSLKADSGLMPEFLETLIKQKAQGAFRNFLPEEFLFDKTKKS